MTKKQKICKEQDRPYRPYDREDNRKKKRNSHGKLNSFTWSATEEFLYVEFLKNNKNLFSDVKERKKSKVFVVMSQYLKKRGPDQCRSHHQKMSIKYGDIDSIIDKITQEKINKPNDTCQEENSVSQSKTVKTQKSSFYDIQIEEDSKLDQKQQSLQILQIQMTSFSQEFMLWDCLNEDAWINV